MSDRAGQNRQRALSFGKTIDPQQLEKLRRAILAIDGVTKLDTGESMLSVEYVFPACSYMDIWIEIQDSGLARNFSLFRALLEWMRANAEATEQHRLKVASDCFSYSRDIYVEHHHRKQQQAMDSHKHLWRRHQRKK